MREPGEAVGGPLRFGVLGPLEVTRDGGPVKIGGPKARAVLAMLVLDANRTVSVSRLIDGVWGEDPPTGVQATLQVHMSNVRKVLGGETVATRSPGYVLLADAADVDLACFEADVAAAREASGRGDLAAARDRLATALGRWRGLALSDVLDAPFAGAAAAWLAERRAHAVEEHAEVSLTLGLHRELVADLEAAVHEAPHRERLWEHLMLALYRSSRQADALATYQRARRRLGEDLGIDPGLGLRKLEAAILDQDPALDLDPNGVGPASVADPDDPGDTYRAPAQARCRLVLEDGTERPLDGLITIGRHPECAVCLPDPAVSRRHAELRPALGGFLLVDLGSSNGTLVNDGPAVHHMLVDGDLIGIGAHRLTYRSEPAKRLGSSDL